MAELTDKLVEIFKNKDIEALAALYREDGVLVHPFFPEPLKAGMSSGRQRAACSPRSTTSSWTLRPSWSPAISLPPSSS